MTVVSIAAGRAPADPRRRSRSLTAEQTVLIDFLWEYIHDTGLSPRQSDIADVVGTQNYSARLQSLRIRGLVGLRKITIPYLHQKCLAVIWVMHPDRGHAVSIGADEDFIGDPFTAKDPDEAIRKCLCCRGEFLSAHRFNRLCELCRIDANEMCGSQSGGSSYLSNVGAIIIGKMGGFARPDALVTNDKRRSSIVEYDFISSEKEAEVSA